MDPPDEHDLLLPLVTEENACLPLPINVVARYWDVDIPLSEAEEAARRYPPATGSVMIEGIELAERHGLRGRILHSGAAELKRLIDMGIPPVVILPGIHDTIQHASVISGYDPDDRTVMHYVPKMEKDGSFHVGIIPEERFDGNWSEDGRLMIVVAPPDIAARLKSHDAEERSNRLCFESERHRLTQDPGRSIGLLREALSLRPGNTTAHLMLAGILNEENSSDCVGHYEECIRLNGRSYLAYRGMGNYFLKTKQFDRAEQYYSRAIDVNAERFGPIYKNRGIARMEQKDNRGARADLRRYLELTPNARDAAGIRDAIRELERAR